MARKAIILVLAGFVVMAGALIDRTVYAGPKELAEIVKAAEREGTVTMTDSLKDEEAEFLFKAFNKDYPKIKVLWNREAGSQEAFLREVVAGAQVSDVVKIDPDIENEMLKMDVLAKVDWTDFNVPPMLVLPDRKGLIVGPYIFSYIFIYNSKLLKKEDVPKTYADFLDPKWKGKFILDTDFNAFLYLVGAWGPDKVLDYLTKLKSQNPIFVRGQSKNLALMAAGDYSLTINGMLSSAVNIQQKGGPLAWNAPETVAVDLYKMGIMKRAKHPNAARVLLGWLLSKGSKLIDEVTPGYGYPLGGTLSDKLFKGKTLSWAPSMEKLPNRPEFFSKMAKAVGAK